MIDGEFGPGKHEDRQSFSLSPNPMSDTQLGAVSKRLRNDDTSERIFRESNIPRGYSIV